MQPSIETNNQSILQTAFSLRFQASLQSTILMSLDLVMLSRIQFAMTIMFHYLFPPLTIGLGIVLV